MAADDGEPTPPASRRRGRAAKPSAAKPRTDKPSAAALGVDLASLDWQRSGTEDGAFEVAFVGPGGVVGPVGVVGLGGVEGHGGARGRGAARGTAARPSGKQAVKWVLLRVAGDPAGRVLVYDRTEWQSFVDGAANGEFDWAAELHAYGRCAKWSAGPRAGRRAGRPRPATASDPVGLHKPLRNGRDHGPVGSYAELIMVS